MDKYYYIYFLTNKHNTVIYTGITNDLVRRVYEHKSKLCDGFSKKYNLSKLVYYEIFSDPESAIFREKQIKALNEQESRIKEDIPRLKNQLNTLGFDVEKFLSRTNEK